MSESTWSPSPAAEQLQAIQKAVAGYVLMPTDDEVIDCANQGIRRAIDRMNSRSWNWALTYSTITFVAGTQEYALDAGFKAPRNLALRDSASVDRSRLMFLPWGTFLKECQWDYLGTPQYYSATNVNFFGVIRMDVAPSDGFIGQYPTGRLWYHRRISYPTATGSGQELPSEAVAYIVEFASGYAADRFAVEKAAAAYGRAKELFNPGPGPSGALVRDDCHGQQTDWE